MDLSLLDLPPVRYVNFIAGIESYRVAKKGQIARKKVEVDKMRNKISDDQNAHSFASEFLPKAYLAIATTTGLQFRGENGSPILQMFWEKCWKEAGLNKRFKNLPLAQAKAIMDSMVNTWFEQVSRSVDKMCDKMYAEQKPEVKPVVNLRAWAKENGIVLHSNIDYHHEFSTGRGCQAKERVEKGDEIARIPLECCIGYDAHFGDAKLFPTFSAAIKTALCLLKESLKGEESKFHVYLKSLRDTPRNLVRFSADERLELSGTSLDWAKNATDGEENFLSTISPFIETAPEHFPKKVTYPMFQRAMAVVLSRGFHLNKQGPFLVPFADSLNHHCEHPHTKLEGTFDCGNIGFVMRAEKDVYPGEEVFNTYGNLPSHQLLQTFGFVPKHKNPHDVYAFSSEIIKEVFAEEATYDEESEMDQVFDESRIEDLKKAGVPYPPSCTENDVSELVTVCFWLGPFADEEVVPGIKLDEDDGEPFVESLRLALGVVGRSVDFLSETKVKDPVIQLLHEKERALLHLARRVVAKQLTDILSAPSGGARKKRKPERNGANGSGRGGPNKRGKKRRN